VQALEVSLPVPDTYQLLVRGLAADATVAAAPMRPSVMPPTRSTRPDARRRNLRFIYCSRLVMDDPAQPSVSALRAIHVRIAPAPKISARSLQPYENDRR
jgi:hypothetical protein